MGLGSRFTAPGRLAPRARAATGAVEAAARQLADQIIRERALAQQRARNGRTYTPFDPS
jgi:hypothetical protein